MWANSPPAQNFDGVLVVDAVGQNFFVSKTRSAMCKKICTHYKFHLFAI